MPVQTPERPIGDARVAKTHRVVLAAAARLLVERGPAAFTVEAVVERTGVALTTIYRHWPSRNDLLAAAIASLGEQPEIPDTGSLRGDLLEFFTMGAHKLEDSHWDKRMQTLPGLIEAGQRDPKLSIVVTQVVVGMTKALQAMLKRGQARGEVRTDRDLEAMADVLLGALFVRRGYRGEEISDAYIGEVVHTLVEGVAARKPA